MNIDLYNKVRDKIDTGDWIGWRSKSVIGWGIRFWQGLRYGLDEPINHIAIVKRQEFAGAERVWIVEALEYGLQLRLLSERLIDFKGAAFWYQLKPLYKGVRPVIGLCIDEAINRIDKEQVAYDLDGCLGNFWKRTPKDAREFYCSEVAYMIHEDAVSRYSAICQGGAPSKAVVAEMRKANAYLKNRAPMPGDTPLLGLFEPAIKIL